MSRPAAAVASDHDPHDPHETHDDIIHPPTLPFVAVHLACLAAVWTGVTTTALVLCAVLYLARMFGVTAGYHRYFSHRSYRTSRVGQFLLAWLAQSSAQRGVLWWAAKHRHHHKHSDTEHDVHSPRLQGFWHAHVGWIFSPQHDETDLSSVPDLTKYPELVWLDRHPYLPATVLALLCAALDGWAGLVVGFFWSTVLLYHGTFMINSLAHVHGRQRFVTGDDSRNNWLLALVTLGEGWHNNHHAYQRSTRQGFRWWEIDPTYYALKALSWVRVTWDLAEPPPELVRGERRLGRAVLEKVARQLADSFPADRIAAQARGAWAHAPSIEELRTRAHAAGVSAAAMLAQLSLPHLPSADELRQRAQEMFAHTPSLDDIVQRARELLAAEIAARLLATGPEPTAA